MIPFALSIIVPTALGFLSEEKVPDEKAGVQWHIFERYPYLIALCAVMALCAICNALLGILFFHEKLAQMIFALSASLLLAILAFLWLPRMLACCNLYMFMAHVLYINLSGALDYWYTADADCVPGGPNFDYTYYITYTTIVGAVSGLVGISVFQHYLSAWSFRPLFWIGTILGVIGATFDLFIIHRLNLKVGIPDEWFYVSGNAVLRPILGAAAHMPAIVLTSKLVPKGLESTTYALLAGFQNFGSVVSSQVGVFVTKAVGIKTTDGECNFDNFATLVLVAHCLLPLLAIPLTFVLIPDKRMTDVILDADKYDLDPTAPTADVHSDSAEESKTKNN